MATTTKRDTELTGVGLAEFAKTKLGTAYVFGSKQPGDGPLTQARVNTLAKLYPSHFTQAYLNKIAAKKLIGKICCDCSGLISWYTGRVLGSSQLYAQAYARLPISQYKKFAIGTVLWRSGHVGVYIGNGLLIEAKGIDYGTVESKVENTKFTHGLTFSWINYTYDEKVSDVTYKGTNPYPVPTSTVRMGNSGNNVKWLQWELTEAGLDIRIDGSFGNATYVALKKFQTSSMIQADGICGPQSRATLIGSTEKIDGINKVVVTETKKTSDKTNSDNPYPVPTKTLKSGAEGDDVKWLQTQLRKAGSNVAVTGKFNVGTLNAVKSYQKKNNLEVDGFVGPKTRASLQKL